MHKIFIHDVGSHLTKCDVKIVIVLFTVQQHDQVSTRTKNTEVTSSIQDSIVYNKKRQQYKNTDFTVLRSYVAMDEDLVHKHTSVTPLWA